MITEGVNVFYYTFAGKSSDDVVKFVFNRISAILSSKKCNRKVHGRLAKCTDMTHLSSFTSYWYASVPKQCLMGMEVAENVSELMNMFSGVSNKKNYLVEFVQDDPHMNYATTDEKVNPLLSI